MGRTSNPQRAPDFSGGVLDLLPRLFAAGGVHPPRSAGSAPGSDDEPGCPPFPANPPTPLQLRAALHLARAGAENGLTVGELASALGLSISRASRIADELERDGMLARERDSADRRVVRLFPSEWARKMGQRLIDRQSQAVTHALELTPTRERAAAIRFLERLVEALEQRATSSDPEDV